jgi:uncharacterized glyoxalase superfamily protein PhnB
VKLHPNIELSFNGQCEDAFGCYEGRLNGTNTFSLTWGDSPMAAVAGLPEGSPAAGEGGGVRFWLGDGGAEASGAGGGH